MKDETKQETKKPTQPKENFVQVAVVTTSGSYPEKGFERTPEHQKIKVILEKTIRELKIADSTGWVSIVGETEVNVDASYIDQGLQGEIEIDYGPREGGGGYA